VRFEQIGIQTDRAFERRFGAGVVAAQRECDTP
jgi:hypothetical protein